MGCIKGCAGLFVGAFVVTLIANTLGKGAFALILLVLAAGAGYVIYANYKLAKTTKHQDVALLSDALFGTKLPQDIAKMAASSALLAYDTTFKWRVVRSEDFAENFKVILEEYEGKDGEVFEDFQVQLVCEPANPLNPNAVAVTWGGLIIGYMAKLETPSLFAFIMNMGGVAQAKGRLTFGVEDNSSTVRLDIAMPFSLAEASA